MSVLIRYLIELYFYQIPLFNLGSSAPSLPPLKTIYSNWRIHFCQCMILDMVKWLQILCVIKLFLECAAYIINRYLIIGIENVKCI